MDNEAEKCRMCGEDAPCRSHGYGFTDYGQTTPVHDHSQCRNKQSHSAELCRPKSLKDEGGWREFEANLKNPQVRVFDTGATRSSDAGRHDPEGFMSPLVVDRFNEYMDRHRYQADGNVRDSDNWQKGMPLTTYIKGMWRHFLHFWLRHRGWPVNDPKAEPSIEDDLCAIIFNAQGYLHELIKTRIGKA